jgi:hypothetical protein
LAIEPSLVRWSAQPTNLDELKQSAGDDSRRLNAPKPAKRGRKPEPYVSRLCELVEAAERADAPNKYRHAICALNWEAQKMVIPENRSGDERARQLVNRAKSRLS